MFGLPPRIEGQESRALALGCQTTVRVRAGTPPRDGPGSGGGRNARGAVATSGGPGDDQGTTRGAAHAGRRGRAMPGERKDGHSRNQGGAVTWVPPWYTRCRQAPGLRRRGVACRERSSDGGGRAAGTPAAALQAAAASADRRRLVAGPALGKWMVERPKRKRRDGGTYTVGRLRWYDTRRAPSAAGPSTEQPTPERSRPRCGRSSARQSRRTRRRADSRCSTVARQHRMRPKYSPQPILGQLTMFDPVPEPQKAPQTRGFGEEPTGDSNPRPHHYERPLRGFLSPTRGLKSDSNNDSGVQLIVGRQGHTAQIRPTKTCRRRGHRLSTRSHTPAPAAFAAPLVSRRAW